MADLPAGPPSFLPNYLRPIYPLATLGVAPTSPSKFAQRLASHASAARARNENYLRPAKLPGASSSKKSARIEANGHREQVASRTGDGVARHS